MLELLGGNSTLTPMIFNGPGKPIWVGRDFRSASIAQWKALIARDRGCIICGADPSRCEAHHVVAWNEFGATNITNLVLVCTRCHHDIHDRALSFRRSDGRWEVARAGPGPDQEPHVAAADDGLFLTA